jgi:hypothetical protein
MIKVARYDDNFNSVYETDKRTVIVYGAGGGLDKYFKYLTHIDVICDRKAGKIKEYQGIHVIDPSELKKYDKPLYIIISLMNRDICNEIIDELEEKGIDATVFYLYDNIAFGYNYYDTLRTEYDTNLIKDVLSVNIVCRDESWIFSKFVDRMSGCLKSKNVKVSVSKTTRDDVDINHHICYMTYEPRENDTLMITHVDCWKKLDILKKQLEIAGMGICMSSDTMTKLIDYGIPRKKLCYINPAHDQVIKPHKYLIGITNRCYDKGDLRRRASALLDILDDISTDYFKFFIMGSGWDEIVEHMQKSGFEIEYFPHFDYEIYVSKMQLIDYYMFTGFDEGSMGFLDALTAGAGTIVTPQGFHLDVGCNIDYPCSTVEEFRNAFIDLKNKREEKIMAVDKWTWDNYTNKHLEIWNYLLKRVPLSEIYKNQLLYKDGIFSTLIEDNRI